MNTELLVHWVRYEQEAALSEPGVRFRQEWAQRGGRRGAVARTVRAAARPRQTMEDVWRKLPV